ncbi:MAG: DUF167 domain-containing protein [Actinomycetales bacterium]
MTASSGRVLRLRVHVRPAASRTEVGGAHDGALVVRVQPRAVDGAATEAALDAVARALGLRRSAVALVTGATSRSKVVQVDVSGEREAEVADRLEELLGVGQGR